MMLPSNPKITNQKRKANNMKAKHTNQLQQTLQQHSFN